MHTASDQRKLLISTTIGSIFEIFDFISFVFLTAILAQVFFPAEYGTSSIWFTYIAITISYLLRPVGGLVLGHLGDKYGRKSIFTLSLLLMSIPALVIGLLPTYAHIGYTATALLILMRIFQGFSVGGEVPGSITYIAEEFKNKNFYFMCAWLTFGANFAVFFASFSIKLLMLYSSHQFMLDYGWRIPFLFGSLLTIIGFYFRKNIKESESFSEHLNSQSKIPVFELFKDHKKTIINGVMLAIIVSITTSVFHVFLPNLFMTYYHQDGSYATTIASSGALTMAIMSLGFGYLCKYFRPINIMTLSLCALLAVYITIFSDAINLEEHLFAAVIVISFILAGVNGIFFGFLATLFTTENRFSGIALCYNLAYILGAGLTPLWTSTILEKTDRYSYILIACIVITVLAIINALTLRKHDTKID